MVDRATARTHLFSIAPSSDPIGFGADGTGFDGHPSQHVRHLVSASSIRAREWCLKHRKASACRSTGCSSMCCATSSMRRRYSVLHNLPGGGVTWSRSRFGIGTPKLTANAADENTLLPMRLGKFKACFENRHPYFASWRTIIRAILRTRCGKNTELKDNAARNNQCSIAPYIRRPDRSVLSEFYCTERSSNESGYVLAPCILL